MDLSQSRLLTLLTRFILIIATLLLLLLLSVWVASPWIIRYQANNHLEPLGFRLNDAASIRINPFSLSLTLTNIELADINTSNTYARIKNGYINIEALPLSEQNVVFENLFFGGLYLAAERQEELIKVAGFRLSSEETDEPLPEETHTPDWTIDIERFTIEDFEAAFIDNQQSHTIHLNALKLKDLLVRADGQRGHLDIAARINDADLETRLDFDFLRGDGKVNIDFKLTDLQLERFGYLAGQHINQAQAEVSLQFSNTVTIKENSLSVALSKALLKLEKVKLSAQGYELNNSSTELSLADSTVILSNGELSDFTGLAGLSIEKTALFSSLHPHQLLGFDAIKIPGANLKVDQDATYDLSSDLITLANIVISKPQADAANSEASLPALMTIHDISLHKLALRPDSLDLGSILLSGFESSVILDKNRDLANLVAFSEGTSESEEPTEPPVQDNPFQISLGKFELEQLGQIHLVDQSIEPLYERSYTVDTLRFADIKTGDKTNSSPFALALNSDKYTKVSAEGNVQLFSDKANLALNATIREFSLPRISPFVRQAAGFDMLSGQLDSDIKVSIVDDEITGNTGLVMRGLEISTADDVKTGSLSEQSFIPLNIALGALKDGDGTINMDVPLSGNVNDPDFGISGFMSLVAQKAALSASRSYLLTTFVPYANVISLTQIVGEYALKVRIDDLIYNAGQTELEAPQIDFSDSIVALLKDKQDITIKLCAIATKEDIGDSAADITAPGTIAILKELAQQRSNHFKDSLVEQGGISSSRLLLCQPKIDGQEDAKPRIEFDV